MSSLGGQWRVLRHYLSASNLHMELEKLVQRLRPASPAQWDYVIKKFERVVSTRLSQATEEVKLNKDGSVKNVTVQQTAAAERTPKDTMPAEKREETERSSGSVKPVGPSVGLEEREITIESLLQGLRLRKDLHFGKISEPGWKDNKPLVTKSSIHSRTSYVISAIVSAASEACVAKRTEDFIEHINQYPEARDLAIKEGAVRALLRVQDRIRDESSAAREVNGIVDEVSVHLLRVQDRIRDESSAAREVNGIVDEALALVGYCAPTHGPGPSVLSLDGGGIRGLIAIEVLRHLERLTGRRVDELFDYIIGVSTGAIIAAVIGGGVGNLETASKLYHTLSKEMFGDTSLIGGTSRLVWSHSYYDTAKWERMLQDNLGDCMLTHCNRKRNPKMALVSCVVNAGNQRLSPFLFRTYSCGFRVRGALRGTTRAKMWHAVRASAAAPTYFAEFHQDGLVHQDGGLMVNNPAGVGLHEARLLWGAPALARGTLLSLGTGQALAALAARPPSAARDNDATAGTSWKDKFNTILDSATDTEGVHLMLNDLLPSGSYFRFNPPLMEACAMDEIDPKKIHNMITDTQAYIRRNQHKFEEAARRLVRRRTLLQRLSDRVHRRALLMGLTHTH